MKKILLSLILLFFTSLPAVADTRSGGILSKMEKLISSWPVYEVKFTASLDGEFYDMEGTYIVSGNKYFLDVYGSRVFYDGVVRSVFSVDDNEVVLENPDPADNGILSDPASVFKLYDRDFFHNFVRTEGDLEVVELSPKKPNGVFDSITLRVDKSSSLPLSINYMLSGMKKDMEIKILSISRAAAPDGTFTFDPSKYPGVEIIDFR